MYRTVCPNPGHDWDYENSRIYSEEAFAYFLEWRLPGVEVDDIDDEDYRELRKEFLRLR